MLILKILGILLQVIGWILLIALLLIVLIAAIILLVPLRYRIELQRPIEGQDAAFLGKLRITWLFHLISLELQARGFKVSGALKLAWFSLKQFGQTAEDKAEEKRPAGETEVKEETKEEPAKENAVKEETEKEEAVREETAKEESVKAGAVKEESASTDSVKEAQIKPEEVKAPQEVSEEPQATDREAETSSEKPDKLSGIMDKLSGLPEALCSLLGQVIDLPDQVYEKAEGLGKKIEGIQKKSSIWLSDPARKLYGRLFRRIKILLRHFRPRRVRGYLRYGVGGPDKTGMLTGLLYMILPAGAGKFSLEPDFTENKFETDMRTDGHVRLVHAGILVLAMLLNKDAWHLLKLFLAGRRRKGKRRK